MYVPIRERNEPDSEVVLVDVLNDGLDVRLSTRLFLDSEERLADWVKSCDSEASVLSSSTGATTSGADGVLLSSGLLG